MSIWIQAVRPKTLVASIAPVLVGTAYVWNRGTIDWFYVPFTVVCAVLIQVASNFINELEDFNRGADKLRVGPQRAVSAGLIKPLSMKRASWGVILVAFVLGMPLVLKAGVVVLAIGVGCLLMSWLYTGGPYPLAYHGLGEVAAFVFFGVVAVGGTVYVHEQTIAWEQFYLAIPSGLMAANILAVNNIRDVYTDAASNKHTIAVRLGPHNAKFGYAISMIGAVFACPLLFSAGYGAWMYLPLIALPLAVMQVVLIFKRNGKELNAVLASTAAVYVELSFLIVLAFVAAGVSGR
ncbi:MAG: 1,4-dihydroxy-2-naphthoate polyprenyltransferase [Ignavibacteria bacterium]|nr:1,4-dihydroxy-2-naphthoate polyprenyltransferase [Ignavibacteria bacterium]